MLYLDADDNYGPLSQYFNAALFALFGPGLMVLVAANLVIFAGIVAAIYGLFRQAWGPGAAWVSSALFISVFAFSAFDGIGNFNYATPYAHETTHGILACLLLVTVLPAWVERGTLRHSFVAGSLFGLAAVLKAEIMFAAGVVTLAAVAVRRWRYRPLRRAAAWSWFGGALLPTAAFSVYFSRRVQWGLAWELACQAWWNATATTRFTIDPVQMLFLGFDRPWRHLLEHVGATLFALVLIAAIGANAWLADRATDTWRRLLLPGAIVAGIAVLSYVAMPWALSGRCLLGLTLFYGFVCATTPVSGSTAGTHALRPVLRLLLAVLAAALMGRMLLNGRIFHYGFYQAALAALLIPAVLIGEFPARLGVGRWGRAVAVASSLGLLVPGAAKLASNSRAWLQVRTTPVGDGRDLFFTLPLAVNPTGKIVDETAKWIRTTAAGGEKTLLVLPEGEMINYLARLPSPVAPFFFYSSATHGDREAAIVRDLDRHPPDWVVLVSRDLREFGVQRYGERPDQGGQIMDWVRRHYKPLGGMGGDPLDIRQTGAIVLGRP